MNVYIYIYIYIYTCTALPRGADRVCQVQRAHGRGLGCGALYSRNSKKPIFQSLPYYL